MVSDWWPVIGTFCPVVKSYQNFVTVRAVGSGMTWILPRRTSIHEMIGER